MAKLQICCDMTKQPPLILHFRTGAEGAERIKQRKKAGLSQIKFVSLLTDYTLIYTYRQNKNKQYEPTAPISRCHRRGYP